MTGYRISYEDFVQLVGYLPYRSAVAPVLAGWYGLEIVGAGDETVVRGAGGGAVDLFALHTEIQADLERRRTLYNVAQSLWR